MANISCWIEQPTQVSDCPLFLCRNILLSTIAKGEWTNPTMHEDKQIHCLCFSFFERGDYLFKCVSLEGIDSEAFLFQTHALPKFPFCEAS